MYKQYYHDKEIYKDENNHEISLKSIGICSEL
jgi:hypothetical protein